MGNQTREHGHTVYGHGQVLAPDEEDIILPTLGNEPRATL